VLRDTVEHPQVARRAAESLTLAAERGIPAVEIRAGGEHPLVRLAHLVGLTDYASVRLALAQGVDPTPVAPIVTLKERLARRG
jgi:glucose/mannose-6-phosphate isomerase